MNNPGSMWTMILSLIYVWPNIVLLQWGTPAFESGPAICSSTMRFGIGQYIHQRHQEHLHSIPVWRLISVQVFAAALLA